MKQRVYIETTIVSYLTSKPSRDLIVAANQAATQLWWRLHRTKCELFASELVVKEAGRGDEDASRQRLELLSGIPLLSATLEAQTLARNLVRAHVLPSTEEDDAAHVALAAVHGMDILLTWNCRHIANVIAAPGIRSVIENSGYRAPTITTPAVLLAALGEMS